MKNIISFFLFLFLSFSAVSQNLDTLHSNANLASRESLDSAIHINDLYYEKAKEIDTSDIHLVNAINNYALFYSRNGMFIKGAEKAKKIINKN